MGEVIPFDFEARKVRVVMRDYAPVFVGQDVCRVLGISKYRDALASLDADERVSMIVDTLGGPQAMTAVTQSGLFALIFMGKAVVAKRFRKWVTSEVLPALLRDGYYRMPGQSAAEQDRLAANRAYLETLPEVHQATAQARAAIMRQIAVMMAGGLKRGAAMEAASALTGIPKRTLYNYLVLIRMVPEVDWPAALAPQWNNGARARQADKALPAPRSRRTGIPRPSTTKGRAA